MTEKSKWRSWFGRGSQQEELPDIKKSQTEQKLSSEAMERIDETFSGNKEIITMAHEVLGAHANHGLYVLTQIDDGLYRTLERIVLRKGADTRAIKRLPEFEIYRSVTAMTLLISIRNLNNVENLPDASRILSELRDMNNLLRRIDPASAVHFCTHYEEGMPRIVNEVASDLRDIREGIKSEGFVDVRLPTKYGHLRPHPPKVHEMEKHTDIRDMINRQVREEVQYLTTDEKPVILSVGINKEGGYLQTQEGEVLAIELLRRYKLRYFTSRTSPGKI